MGAAVLSNSGAIFVGCNIQQKFHTSDLHAEVTAIAAMLSAGHVSLDAIAIVSNNEGVPPCGACRDWIVEFGGDTCWVIWEGEDVGSTQTWRASELLPFHPLYN